MKQILAQKGVENEIVLLREKNIQRCHGCVEFCNPKGICCQKDDVEGILNKMVEADGFIFISPNYFQMPTGLLKDFMDRSCVLFSSGRDKSVKNIKTVVICVGAETPDESDVCAKNIADLYFRYFGKVVAIKSFQTKSELKGNYNDIFENGTNPNIEKELEELVEKLIK
jgi:multimeric flavodoxin WrbA